MPSEGASVAQSPLPKLSSKDEKVHTVDAAIVAVLLDAMTMRPGTAVVAMVMNQRLEWRSKRIRPPNVAPAPRTAAKKVSGLRLRAASGTPAFVKLRMRPLATTIS